MPNFLETALLCARAFYFYFYFYLQASQFEMFLLFSPIYLVINLHFLLFEISVSIIVL